MDEIAFGIISEKNLRIPSGGDDLRPGIERQGMLLHNRAHQPADAVEDTGVDRVGGVRAEGGRHAVQLSIRQMRRCLVQRAKLRRRAGSDDSTEKCARVVAEIDGDGGPGIDDLNGAEGDDA